MNIKVKMIGIKGIFKNIVFLHLILQFDPYRVTIICVMN